MIFYVYTKTGERNGFLTDYTSIQWNLKYNETGTFELHVVDTELAREQLQLWNIITAKDDRLEDSCGIIESVDFPSDTNEIVARGHMDPFDSLINRETRLISSENSIYGIFHTGWSTGDEENAGCPVGYDILGSDSYYLDKDKRYETTYTTLRELLATFCEKSGMGYRVRFDEDKGFIVAVYNGKQNNVWFSEKNGSLLQQRYLQDYSEYKNIAYVYGAENTDGSRANITVSKKVTGEPFLELYVDARDIQWTYTDANNNEVTYTEDEYYELLSKRGIEKLKETRGDMVTNEFEVDTSSVWKLGEDYQLGDICKVVSEKFGWTKEVRITGLKYINEETGETFNIEVEEIQDDDYSISIG